MRPGNPFAKVMLCLLALLMISCSSPDSGAQHTQSGDKNDDQKVLNFYNWDDYIGPSTISSFEKLTGIKVRGGSGFSDRGVSGYLSGQYSNRRADIHEKAKT